MGMAPKSDQKMKDLFDASELAVLRGKAKELIENGTLTLGDMWRFSGWTDGRPDPNADPDLKDVSMDSLHSVAEACAKRLKRTGETKTWKYNATYSCCACTACCCAVVVLP